jgi:hypothetical protein
MPSFRVHKRKQEFLVRTNRLLSFHMTRTSEKTTRPTIILLLRVYLFPWERVYRAVA